MRALLDTSVPIGAKEPGTLEGAISAASLAQRATLAERLNTSHPADALTRSLVRA